MSEKSEAGKPQRETENSAAIVVTSVGGLSFRSVELADAAVKSIGGQEDILFNTRQRVMEPIYRREEGM